MNCQEFRRALGADPNLDSVETRAHIASCPACEQYAQEMLRLNGLIKRALTVPAPEQKQFVAPIGGGAQSMSSWYAMAASIVLAVAVVLSVIWFAGFPRESIASQVVAHLAHEPYAMTPTEARVSAEVLDGALQAKGLKLAEPMNDVSYVQSCVLRGHFVPHLVVQTEQGPVTVMLLVEEQINEAERFVEAQYQGVLVPTKKGGMAVIADDVMLAERVADRVQAAIDWK